MVGMAVDGARVCSGEVPIEPRLGLGNRPASDVGRLDQSPRAEEEDPYLPRGGSIIHRHSA